MLDLGSINWLSVLPAGIAYFILGGLWFAPFAFQRHWDKALGFCRTKDWKATPDYYVIPLLGCLIICVATVLLLHATGARSYADAVTLGVIVGVGYLATIIGVVAIAPTTPRPGLLMVVVGSYHVIGAVVVAVILFALR